MHIISSDECAACHDLWPLRLNISLAFLTLGSEDGSREVAPRSSYKYFSIQVLSMELRPKAEHQKIVDVAKLLRSACTIQGDSSKAGYRDCGLP